MSCPPPDELRERDPMRISQSADVRCLQYSGVLQLDLHLLRVKVSGAVLCVRPDTPGGENVNM